VGTALLFQIVHGHTAGGDEEFPDAAATVKPRTALAVAFDAAESLTVTAKLNVPDAVGVPEITPAELNVSPDGRLVADHT
jgi:hypothetical protein